MSVIHFRSRMQKLIWLIDYLKTPKYKQTYINQYSGRCCVLANGPSLKDAFHKFDMGELEITSDSIVMNLAALEKHFWIIKPKHMCFADIMFCMDYDLKKEQIKRQFQLLNEKVDWDMNLYLCYDDPKHVELFKSYSILKNPHLHLIPMNRIPCNNWPRKYWLKALSSGIAMPRVGTVSNVALNVALLCGYKQIELYGVDQNWFLHFGVNDDNLLCTIEEHFYDKEGERVYRPFLSPYKNGGNKFVSECMETLFVQARSHEIHAWWAKQIGATIINMTPGSIIDAFDRIGSDGVIHQSQHTI